MQQPKGVSMSFLDDAFSFVKSIPFVGDIAKGIFSANQASKQRDFNASQAEISRDWQEQMANTQYQRTVQDLNAAGLSPMLAYSKGSTSLPSGATASSSAMAEAPDLGATSQRQSLVDLQREQLKVAQSQELVNAASAEKLRAEADNVRQDTENKRLYPGFNQAQIDELLSRAGQHGASAGQLRALMDEIRQTINLRKPEEQFKGENPNVAKYMSPLTSSLETIFKGVGLLRGSSALPNVSKIVK